ncbi:hypothetical protein JCM5353_005691 [Sporobolomyces roseus]
MLFFLTLSIALIASALAAPAITSTLEPREHGLALQAYVLEKRQSVSNESAQAVVAYANILQRAVQATSSSGQCSSECRPWVSAVTSCSRQGGGYTNIGVCSCGEDVIGQMEPCGTCLGYTSEIDNVETTCRQEVASISASGLPSSSNPSNPNTSPVVVGTPAPSSTSDAMMVRSSIIGTIAFTLAGVAVLFA